MTSLSELRLGNYVRVVDGNIIKINKYDMMCILTNTYEVKPIPLTEEMLLKCGFKKTYYGYKYYVERILNFVLKNNEISLGYFDDDDWCRIGKPIKHLHQLQNLCFLLTGEELKIEL